MVLGRMRPRLRGAPPSANGASSFHLWWCFEHAEPLREVAAVLEIVEPPTVPQLYFWALQAGFHDGRGPVGAGHTGLQWLPADPPRPAVNWGGYDSSGRELGGSTSDLPSLDDNPNTRLFDWLPGRPYELRVRPGSAQAEQSRSQAWQATVTDLSSERRTVIRELHVAGSHLSDPVVWSEIFAHCDHPTVTVRWSQMRAITDTGRTVVPTGVSVTYQRRSLGGCDNTTSRLDSDGRGVLQETNSTRTVPEGTVMALSPV